MVRKYRIDDARVEAMVTVTPEENWILHTIRYMDVNLFLRAGWPGSSLTDIDIPGPPGTEKAMTDIPAHCSSWK